MKKHSLIIVAILMIAMGAFAQTNDSPQTAFFKYRSLLNPASDGRYLNGEQLINIHNNAWDFVYTNPTNPSEVEYLYVTWTGTRIKWQPNDPYSKWTNKFPGGKASVYLNFKPRGMLLMQYFRYQGDDQPKVQYFLMICNGCCGYFYADENGPKIISYKWYQYNASEIRDPEEIKMVKNGIIKILSTPIAGWAKRK